MGKKNRDSRFGRSGIVKICSRSQCGNLKMLVSFFFFWEMMTLLVCGVLVPFCGSSENVFL